MIVQEKNVFLTLSRPAMKTSLDIDKFFIVCDAIGPTMVSINRNIARKEHLAYKVESKTQAESAGFQNRSERLPICLLFCTMKALSLLKLRSFGNERAVHGKWKGMGQWEMAGTPGL